MKKINIFLSAILPLLVMVSSGCRESTGDLNVEPFKDHPLGIVSVENSGDGIILNVILQDQFKLQFFEGDVGGGQVWVKTTNRPTPVSIKIEGNTLTMGSFSEAFDTTGIRMKSEFSDITPGMKEIQIATRESEGNAVPISVRLIPTTAEEKATINSGEPSP